LRASTLDAVPRGDVHALLSAIQAFGRGPGRWLKLAAGEKAAVLDMALSRRPLGPHEVLLEVGCFVGFTALRLAAALRLQQEEGGAVAPRRPLVVTLEKDSGSARLAGALIEHAGLAGYVEVWNGRAAELLPRVLEEYGAGSVATVFFDHSGSIYHDDLAAMLRLGLLAPQALVVADNVLKPGAPLFLWQVCKGASFDTELVSVREFAQAPIEDWMAVCTHRGRGSIEGTEAAVGDDEERRPPPPPRRLHELAWEADAWRRRSERSGVTVLEWAEFAAYMRRELGRFGIHATSCTEDSQ